jgi:hypothetical protein
MAERNATYARIPADDYATPAWVTEVLLNAESFVPPILEPAPPGQGCKQHRRAVVVGDPYIDMSPSTGPTGEARMAGTGGVRVCS